MSDLPDPLAAAAEVMGKGTQGPWRCDSENHDDLQRAARFGNVVVYAMGDCDAHPVADCSCNHTCRFSEEQVANAAKIALAVNIAPELIAVARAAGERMDAPKDISTASEDARSDADIELQLALAALDKKLKETL